MCALVCFFFHSIFLYVVHAVIKIYYFLGFLSLFLNFRAVKCASLSTVYFTVQISIFSSFLSLFFRPVFLFVFFHLILIRNKKKPKCAWQIYCQLFAFRAFVSLVESRKLIRNGVFYTPIQSATMIGFYFRWHTITEKGYAGFSKITNKVLISALIWTSNKSHRIDVKYPWAKFCRKWNELIEQD